MSSLADTIKQLEGKLEDLQRDTKFCVNNYDYHHKNNENDILQKVHDILKESLQDGQEFLNNMAKVRSLINTASKKCSEVDEILKDFGLSTEIVDDASDTAGNSLTSTDSFIEDNLKHCDNLENNKENSNY